MVDSSDNVEGLASGKNEGVDDESSPAVDVDGLSESPERPVASGRGLVSAYVGRLQRALGDVRVIVWRRPVSFILIVVFALAGIGFGILWQHSVGELSSLRSSQADDAKAESIAGRYAVGASTFNFQNLDPWLSSLKTGVSDQLKPKFDSAVNVLKPLLQQLQWISTSKLLAADVSRRDGGMFNVQVFVSMQSKSLQFPDGMNSTASYSVTLDKASGWTITDVGGIGAGLPGAINSDGSGSDTGTPAPSMSEHAPPATTPSG